MYPALLLFFVTLLQAGTIPTVTSFNHGGGLLKLQDESFLYCWPGGKSEADKSVKMWCSKSKDFIDWNTPSLKFSSGYHSVGREKKNKSLGNVVLHQDSKGRIWMFYGVIESTGIFCKSWTCGRVDYRVSEDMGETWSEGHRFDSKKGSLPRNKALQLEGDLIALPLYLEREDLGYLKILDLSASVPGKIKASKRVLFPVKKVYQPSIGIFRGSFFALFRDTSSLRKTQMFQASIDSIKTTLIKSFEQKDDFSLPVSNLSITNLANPHSALDTVVDDGFVFSFYNSNSKDRRRLSVACTQNIQSPTFKYLYDIEKEQEKAQWAYPYVIQDRKFAYMVYSKNKSKLYTKKIKLQLLRTLCEL